MNFVPKLLLSLAVFVGIALITRPAKAFEPTNRLSIWKVQSIDTMKYSRDKAREKMNDLEFDKTINEQVKAIAETGATHVAIGTPYDAEFTGFMKKWVKAARDNNLNVWFRGNFSGWEGWFEYEKITPEEHKTKVTEFIMLNKELFEDGDIFTPCPECENGGPGDPRLTQDVEGFRKFMIDEYTSTQSIFFKLNKGVLSNFNSMNGDVAKLIMDKSTTEQMGGIVTVDHYVESPKKLADDISIIAAVSGGQVVLGEMGVPIPDLNGEMTEDQQAKWLNDALNRLSDMPELYGINYWTFSGSSTLLFNEDNTPRKAQAVLKKYYIPETVEISIKNELGNNVDEAYAIVNKNNYSADTKGVIRIPYVKLQTLVSIEAEGYKNQETSMERLKLNPNIELVKEQEDFIYKLQKFFLTIIKLIKRL